MRKLVILTLMFLASSCSKETLSKLTNGNNNNAQTLSYTLTENGCSTGEQYFSTQDDMCDGLKNDSLNNYCARNLRYQKFQNDCPGHSW